MVLRFTAFPIGQCFLPSYSVSMQWCTISVVQCLFPTAVPSTFTCDKALIFLVTAWRFDSPRHLEICRWRALHQSHQTKVALRIIGLIYRHNPSVHVFRLWHCNAIQGSIIVSAGASVAQQSCQTTVIHESATEQVWAYLEKLSKITCLTQDNFNHNHNVKKNGECFNLVKFCSQERVN